MKAEALAETRTNGKILRLVQLAILTAITVVMALTPLGYLPVGALKISFLMVPVVVGAIVTGPAGGAYLGTVFGITSFMTCVTGTDAFGAMLLELNPFFTFILCVPTRTLAGLFPALMVKFFSKKVRSRFLYPAAALCGSLCNTFFFLGALLLIFGNNTDVAAALGFDGGSIIVYIAATVVALNGALEASACTVVGAGLSGIIDKFSRKK
ncbi:MAG: ECF transporter S component [Ruminococcus sp.]|nr:ECF transporter S component [Ruminococcus sp.]